MSLMNPVVANLVVGPIDRTAANPSISFGASAENNSGTGIRGDILSMAISISGVDMLSLAPSGISFPGTVQGPITISGQLSVYGGAIVLPSFTTTARNALTPAAGWMIFNSTDSVAQVYDGTIWNDLW